MDYAAEYKRKKMGRDLREDLGGLRADRYVLKHKLRLQQKRADDLPSRSRTSTSQNTNKSGLLATIWNGYTAVRNLIAAPDPEKEIEGCDGEDDEEADEDFEEARQIIPRIPEEYVW